MNSYHFYLSQILENEPDLHLLLPKPETINNGYFNKKSGKGRGKANKVNNWVSEVNSIIMGMPYSKRSIFSDCKNIGIIHSMKFSDKILRDCANFEKFTTDTLVANRLIPDDSNIRINIQQFEDWQEQPLEGYVNVYLYRLKGKDDGVQYRTK